MLRFGLCCIFNEAPIRFRRTTAKSLLNLERSSQLARLNELCLHNAGSLLAALVETHRLGFGAFRILSQLFPLFTHPLVGYRLEDLPDGKQITGLLVKAGEFARSRNLRLSFHPDQFVLLSAPKPEVLQASIAELEYQTRVAELVGADVINIHGGGAYGDKRAALSRIVKVFPRLPPALQQRLTLENDDRLFTVSDLLPICRELRVPLIFDVHHHRCNGDGLSVAEATERTVQTWHGTGREPYFHLSSPRHGWGSSDPRVHADYIDPADFPEPWRSLTATVDIEAKAKELAVSRLLQDLDLTTWNR
ncbi:MAG: UV DNA damage repair endonuclease UvsE [Syntrophotaleaceae bacterium]